MYYINLWQDQFNVKIFVLPFYTLILKKNSGIMGWYCLRVGLSVCLSVRKQSSRYLHAILWKCILGLDKVSHTRMIVTPFFVSELCSFENL